MERIHVRIGHAYQSVGVAMAVRTTNSRDKYQSSRRHGVGGEVEARRNT